MRGHASKQGAMFLRINIEEKVPADHPLRAVKRRCDRIPADLEADQMVPHVPVRSHCRIRADDEAGQVRRRAAIKNSLCHPPAHWYI